MKRFLSILLLISIALLGTAGASAEGLELTGTVTATQTETLAAPAAGKVEMCSVMPGDHVEAGTELVSLQTTKVYAEQDGTVRIFGQPGDSVTAITTRYGGVAYIEPTQRYIISASTKNAYDSDDTKLIHAGEKVYLRSTANWNWYATGTVTVVTDGDFTVEVDGDALTSDDTVNIFRDPAYAASSKIGSGKVEQTTAIAYTSTGFLIKLHVQNGQQISVGDLLFETLDGDFVPGSSNMNMLFAEKAGVVAAVNTHKGISVAASEALIDFYPDDGMRITAAIPEDDLSRIMPGMTVEFLLPNMEENTDALIGTVEKISLLPSEESGYGTAYTVYIIPESVDQLRYGMTVTIQIP